MIFRKIYRRLMVWFVLTCGMILLFSRDMFAAGKSEFSGSFDTSGWLRDLEEMSDRESWESIDSWLKEIYGKRSDNPEFTDLVKDLAEGNLNAAGKTVRELFYAAFSEEISRSAQIAGQILSLGLLSAVFANFSHLFSDTQIADTGNLFTSLLVFSLLGAAFQEGVALTKGVLIRQTEFMRILLPTYGIAAAWAGSGTTAVAWMQVIMFLITCVENLYLKLLVPFSQIYVLLVLAGNLSDEDMFSRMTALIRDIVRWGTRALVGVILGFQVVQGMVLPYADSLQTAGIQKVLQLVPGIGTGAGAAVKMVLGAGVVIKNAMGAAGVIVLVIISMAPIIKLAVIVVIYRLTAATLQPVTDKKLTAVVCGVAEGQQLLLGILIYGMIIFIVAIALAGMGTNMTYLLT